MKNNGHRCQEQPTRLQETSKRQEEHEEEHEGRSQHLTL